MEIQFQSPPPTQPLRMSRGKFIPPSSPSSRIINHTTNTTPANSIDFTLSNKTKLLKLADRIQTKKSVSVPNNNVKNSYYSATLTNHNGPNRPSPMKAPPLVNPMTTPTRVPSLEPNKSISFNRTKLYASFSPNKNKNLQKLVKNDPAKTNIEHLVNYRTSNQSNPPVPQERSNVKKSLHASFHDKIKLSNAFSPRSNVTEKSSNKPVAPARGITAQNKLQETPSYHQNSVPGLLLPRSEKISSAQIIPLNKKGGISPRIISTPIEQNGHCPPIIQTEQVELPKMCTPVAKPNFSHEFTQPSSFSKNINKEKTHRTISASENHSILNQSNSHNSYNENHEPNIKSIDEKIIPREPEESSMLFDDLANLQKKSRSLPKSFLSMRKGLRNALITGVWKDELAFERFDKNPKPFETSLKKDSANGTVVNFEENERKLSEISNENPSEALPEHSQTKHTTKIPTDSTLATMVNAEPIKMRIPKPQEGRPQSVDYSQKKNWMSVYHDMEINGALEGSVTNLSNNSSPTTMTPINHTKPPTKNSKKRLNITHLHIPEDPDTTDCLVSSSSPSPDKLAAGSDSSSSNSENSKAPSGSLFQRFSKTFSLRFGNHGSNNSNGSSRTKKSKSNRSSSITPIVATGSTPDIFSARTHSRSDIDPSSGKIRNGTKIPKSPLRNVKCQSGDSGIHEPNGELRRVEYDSGDLHRSPTSMKKLSLVEIPNNSWDSKNKASASHSHCSSEDDPGFVSSNDDQISEDEDEVSGESESACVNNPSTSAQNYYHSLPLKLSREKKAALIEKRKSSIRGNVVQEILQTEHNYVKTLNDIVQGFLIPCRGRSDLFNDKTIVNIFSNIEELLKLHVKFLEAIRNSIDPENVANSQIGHLFKLWAPEFDLYSEYCCHNPMSNATVRQLSLNPEYVEFFEACRRLQLMDKLPLHGFLLRPIQRICQYHLQLTELLKQTDPTHKDYSSVYEAVETMKAVAMKINDTQRQFDSLQEVVRLQTTIDGFEGPDLLDLNSCILHRGDVVKMTEGRKHKEAHLILLDNEILICKKDVNNKKGTETISLNSRVYFNTTVWVNIDSNEEDDYFGMVHNSFRIYDPYQRLWILFTVSSPNDKKKWIQALEKTSPHPNQSSSISLKMKDMAKVTALKLMFIESSIGNSPQSQHHNLLTSSSHNGSTSTLPRLRKSRGKGSSNKLMIATESSGSIGDQMLIEVGKLRKSMIPEAPRPLVPQPQRTSMFYV